MGENFNYLVVIIDVNSFAWESHQSIGNGNFGDVLQSVNLFCNSHKLLNRKNDCCIIAIDSNKSSFINTKKDDHTGPVSDLLACYYSSQTSARGHTLSQPHCALARGLSQAMCGE